MADYSSIETVDDIGLSPRDVVRRWQLELKLASKREKSWRENAEKIYKKWRAAERKKNSFNVLWSNTEILFSSIYNSLPKPDVRRRFKDADPLGKAVSDVISRSLEFSVQQYGFDQAIRHAVTDFLLPGRGICRVRYVPSLRQVGDVMQTGREDAETETDHEALEGVNEELAWEQVAIEHVAWDDFRMGPGKTWDEVQWIAYRHRLTRDELIDLAGEKIGSRVIMSESSDDEFKHMREDDPIADIFKTCEVWEFWDKETRTVLFISDGYPTAPLKEVQDPLGLQHFFDTPCPARAILDPETTIPTPLYDQYKTQAEELDEISLRISKITKALKVRGIYDAQLGELSELLRGDDNDLIPAQNTVALIERGTLDKFIWMMPIEQLAKVLQQLYVQREQCQAVIYQIIGISDIQRGASDPRETASAQDIKAQWGSIRVHTKQYDIQRYVRDLMQLMAEIISEKFQPQTLIEMTQLPYPTAQQAMQMQMKYQMAMRQWQMMAMQAQQSGQQPPQQPQPPNIPFTWDDIIKVLRSDVLRTYKVDVETDSMVASSIQSDMQGLSEVLTGITQFLEASAPLVSAGMLPIEAAKEIALTIARRSKMGNAVEDSLEKLKAPNPPPDPNQVEIQKAQAQIAADQQKSQAKLQSDAAIANQKMQIDARLKQMELAANERQAQMEMVYEQRLEEMKAAMQAQMDMMLARLQAGVDLQKHEMTTQVQAEKAKQDAAVRSSMQ